MPAGAGRLPGKRGRELRPGSGRLLNWQSSVPPGLLEEPCLPARGPQLAARGPSGQLRAGEGPDGPDGQRGARARRAQSPTTQPFLFLRKTSPGPAHREVTTQACEQGGRAHGCHLGKSQPLRCPGVPEKVPLSGAPWHSSADFWRHRQTTTCPAGAHGSLSETVGGDPGWAHHRAPTAGKAVFSGVYITETTGLLSVCFQI